MSKIADSLTAKERARFLEAARLAGLWYLQNQNAPGQAWGGVDQSADLGRFLYEYFPATGQCRGTGVWSQSLAMCLLMSISEAPNYEGREKFAKAAELAASYLCSLQVLDFRNPKAVGGFREHNPQDTWSFPRDAATGCFGLAFLYGRTRNPEYLERANLFCKWYSENGSDSSTWPYDFCDLAKNEGSCKVPGDWQAGGAFAYYYTASVSGDRHWIERGFKPVMERLLVIGDPTNADGDENRWHGESRITVGNDDFATVALLAAFRAFEDERYLEVARRRIGWMKTFQDKDGSFPNGGGTFVTALTFLDFVELAEEKGLVDDTGELTESLVAAARFGLTLQNLDHRDRRAYGGFFGQSNYGVGRDRIHNRDASYGGHLYLRLAGQKAPVLSSLDWPVPR